MFKRKMLSPLKKRPVYLFLLMAGMLSCSLNNANSTDVKPMTNNDQNNRTDFITGKDTATFGAGCFWCVEAIFLQLEGVDSVASGYSGGHVKNPTYRQVCDGTTGHAEVIQVIYDPKVISYADLLQAFWSSHDPTTLNRQGNDIGTQYRSVIYYHSPQQKADAEKYKKELDASGTFANPIVTEISPFEVFYKAEDYHQDYYNLNEDQPYCQFVIRPKIEKFEKVFKSKLKKK